MGEFTVTTDFDRCDRRTGVTRALITDQAGRVVQVVELRGETDPMRWYRAADHALATAGWNRVSDWLARGVNVAQAALAPAR